MPVHCAGSASPPVQPPRASRARRCLSAGGAGGLEAAAMALHNRHQTPYNAQSPSACALGPPEARQSAWHAQICSFRSSNRGNKPLIRAFAARWRRSLRRSGPSSTRPWPTNSPPPCSTGFTSTRHRPQRVPRSSATCCTNSPPNVRLTTLFYLALCVMNFAASSKNTSGVNCFAPTAWLPGIGFSWSGHRVTGRQALPTASRTTSWSPCWSFAMRG